MFLYPTAAHLRVCRFRGRREFYMWQRASQGSGGGADISDIIGVEFAFFTGTTAGYQVLVAGIKKIEVWMASGTCTLYKNSGLTQSVATVTTTHQTIDVSDINALWPKTASGNLRMNLIPRE